MENTDVGIANRMHNRFYLWNAYLKWNLSAFHITEYPADKWNCAWILGKVNTEMRKRNEWL